MEKNKILQQALKQLNALIQVDMALSPSESFFFATGQVSGDGVVTISNSHLRQVYTVWLQPWAPQKDINTLITQVIYKSSDGGKTAAAFDCFY